VIKRSAPGRPEPDLYVFGVPGFFKGYFPGYSRSRSSTAHLHLGGPQGPHANTAGRGDAQVGEPLDRPEISFRYFDEGNDASGEDLDSVVEACSSRGA